MKYVCVTKYCCYSNAFSSLRIVLFGIVIVFQIQYFTTPTGVCVCVCVCQQHRQFIELSQHHVEEPANHHGEHCLTFHYEHY